MSQFMQDLISGIELERVQKEELEGGGKEVVRWEPKEWRPEYQIIVTLHLMNFDQQKIADIMAEKFNYSITKQHVGHVLKTEKAQEFIKEQLGKTIKQSERTLEENLDKMEQLAASRVVELLQDDEFYNLNKTSVVDRALKVLEGRGKLKKEILNATSNQQQNNFFSLPDNILARIEEGNKKASLVEDLHGPNQRSTGEPEKRSGTDG